MKKKGDMTEKDFRRLQWGRFYFTEFKRFLLEFKRLY